MGMAFHCTNCGTALPPDAKFCASCGLRVSPPSQMPAADWSGSGYSVGSEQYVSRFAYAGFWLRFVACIIDSILVNVIFGLIGAMTANSEDGGANLAVLLSIFGNWLYFAVLEAGPWQGTVGKKLLGLIVVDGGGNPISFGRATGRYFGKFVSTVIILIGFIMVGFTARKQALHDIMASTLVIKRQTGFART